MEDYYLKKYLWHLGFLAIISIIVQSIFPMILIVAEVIKDSIEQASWTAEANRNKRLQEESQINTERALELIKITREKQEHERKVQRDNWIEKSKVSFTIEGEAIKYTVKGWKKQYEQWVFLELRSIKHNNIELMFEIKKIPGRINKNDYADTTKLAEIRAFIKVNTYITRQDGLYNPPERITVYRSPDSVLANWSPNGYGTGTSKFFIDCSDDRNKIEVLGIINLN